MATVWTQVGKASGTGWTDTAKAAFSSVTSGGIGQPIGLLLALTYSNDTSIVTDPWTQVAQPTNTAWTTISKAT